MNLKSACRFLTLLAFIWATIGQTSAFQDGQLLNILFIGNSHTYFNGLPRVFKNIASSAGKATSNVSSSTFGGYTLYDHLHKLHTLIAIDSG